MLSELSWRDVEVRAVSCGVTIAAAVGTAVVFDESRFVIISACVVTTVALGALAGLGVCYIASDSKEKFNKKVNHAMALGAGYAAFMAMSIAFLVGNIFLARQFRDTENKMALHYKLQEIRECARLENEALISRCKTMYPTLF